MSDKITTIKIFEDKELVWNGEIKIKGGSITFHFDNNGLFREAEYKYKKKRTKKTLDNSF